MEFVLETWSEDFYAVIQLHRYFLHLYYVQVTESGTRNTPWRKKAFSGFMKISGVMKKLRNAQITAPGAMFIASSFKTITLEIQGLRGRKECLNAFEYTVGRDGTNKLLGMWSLR